MNQTAKDLFYLLFCSVNGITPDKDRTQAMDQDALFELARIHSVESAVSIALERAGIHNERFYQAQQKTIRKNIHLDVERMAITSDFEKQGIWYMPLKGSVLKEIYPENGMRQMIDNDLLYDADKQQQVRDIMTAHGYTAKVLSKYIHDTYFKPPVLSFEMHTKLFYTNPTKPLYKYYSDIKRLLIKDEDSNYAYHFTDEDLYVYLTAHEYKHYNFCGVGIRYLLDCYVYCREKGDSLDWNYITEQTRILEMEEFEKQRRALAFKLFSSDEIPQLSEKENDMLTFYISSGTHGTTKNRVENNLKTQSKLSYWLHRIFIPWSMMTIAVPFTAKSPLLYPLGFVWRCIRVLIFRREKLKASIKATRDHRS